MYLDVLLCVYMYVSYTYLPQRSNTKSGTFQQQNSGLSSVSYGTAQSFRLPHSDHTPLLKSVLSGQIITATVCVNSLLQGSTLFGDIPEMDTTQLPGIVQTLKQNHIRLFFLDLLSYSASQLI